MFFSASQMWLLGRILPLIIGEYVPEVMSDGCCFCSSCILWIFYLLPTHLKMLQSILLLLLMITTATFVNCTQASQDAFHGTHEHNYAEVRISFLKNQLYFVYLDLDHLFVIESCDLRPSRVISNNLLDQWEISLIFRIHSQ